MSNDAILKNIQKQGDFMFTFGLTLLENMYLVIEQVYASTYLASWKRGIEGFIFQGCLVDEFVES